MSVHRTAATLTVTMNRDEARSRGPEIPPSILAGDVSLLGPRDSDRGGMWIAVSNAGVAGCLLNAYFPGDAARGTGTAPAPTRGTIVPSLLQYGGFDEIRAAFGDEFDPDPYPAFTLLLCSLECTFAQTWTGAALLPPKITDEPWTMLVSSSWKTEDVTVWRRGAFAQWRGDGGPTRGHLPTFHVLQAEGEAAWSPLTDREESATRSITQVAIDAASTEATMRYWPRHLLPDGAPALHTLPLRATALRG